MDSHLFTNLVQRFRIHMNGPVIIIMKPFKRINVFSLAKFQAVLSGLVGVLCGTLYAFGGLIIDALVSLEWITSTETPGLSYGTVLAFGAFIAMPAIFAVCEFVLGIVEAVLYNVFAGWFGGINTDLRH